MNGKVRRKEIDVAVEMRDKKGLRGDLDSLCRLEFRGQIAAVYSLCGFVKKKHVDVFE